MSESESSSRRLRVVVLADWLRFPSGMAATNRARLLARGMVEAGADVHVLCMQASDRPPTVENRESRGTWRGVTFEYACGTTLRHPSFTMRRLIELRGWTTGIVRLIQLRRAGRMDGVYIWMTSQRLRWQRVAYIPLLRLLGAPVVIELNERPWALRKDRNVVERLVSPLSWVQGAVSISRYLTRWAEAEAARLGKRFLIIEVPIVVDLEEVPPATGTPDGPPTVVFAGAPEYDDTIHFILRSMDLVWKRYPTCRLVITGARPGDPSAESLARRIATHPKVGKRVRLAGYLPRRDLLQLYRSAYALLIPLFEDVRSHARFPTKIGEYAASARPIVTTDVGEVSRFFTDGKDAFVAKPGDPQAYALSICAALADNDLAARVGAAGRELALSHFDYRTHGLSLNQTFLELAVSQSVSSARRRANLRRDTTMRKRPEPPSR